ncbi:MAG TPA: hypothetical protein VHA37_05415, partial [Candidatus Saccharimonadales bacterium]|nr:hypothetical protein [Candidatus Saccharimonadales bacterium]
YPYWGYGRFFRPFGFGLGYGLGYGLLGGLLGYGYGGYGYGYPYYGYGGYGMGYGGYGYGGCYGCYPYYSYGYGYPYSGYGYGYSSPMYSTYAYGPTVVYGTNGTTTTTTPANPQDTTTTNPNPQTPEEFANEGEAQFRAGNYSKAVYFLKHAVVDTPNNGVLVAMLAQAFFADGKYQEAAGATQQALSMLPEDKWGVVPTNYKELYSRIGDYTTQLRALEQAKKDKPDDAALRFLLGYHYGYLGYPKEAVTQLTKAVELEPRDEMSKKLLKVFQDKLNAPAAQPPAAANP